MSFDGTRTDQTNLTPETPELWFADKCESENFLMLDGQEIHIVESFIGTLEVLIPNAVCDSTDFDAIDALTYYKADGTTAMAWTYDDLCT